MKRFYFILSLLISFSIGQIWAAEESESVTLSTGAFNTDRILWSAAGGKISITQLKGSSSTAVNSSYIASPRVYKGHVLSFVASDGYKINSIEITYNGSYYGNSMTAGIAMNGNTVTDNTTAISRTWATTSGGKHSVSATAAEGESEIYIQNVASSTNTQLRFTALKITYTAPSGGTPEPTVSVDPEEWDFGAVATDASVSKVFSVSGSDLEAGTLTLTAPSGYSVSPESITVASAGALDATNVTVSMNTTTAGTYNGNLTISGCGLENNVEVALSMQVKTKYTVTWNNNGSTSTTQVLDGAKPVFPDTPESCDASSTTFIGWATSAWDGKLANLNSKTVYTKASDMPAVTAAVTYYAVFAKSSGSAANLFEWEGGTSSELTALENVSASGLGSDYAAGNAPYRIKLDTEGDYIVITTSGAIGSVAIGVKMIGGASSSAIYVQEAKDAESDFSDVETLAISGAQNDVLELVTTNTFNSDSRAVKLIFHKGSNVGVGPITIAGAASYSDYMTTCAAPTCEDLGTPSVSVPAANLTYNSAKLTWAAVDHADKYLVKFNGVDQTATSNTYFDASNLDPETTYTYQVKALAAANQTDWCDGAFSAEANFTTEAAPTAHLTLFDIEGTHASSGDYAVGTPFNLPTTAAACSKTFVGWDPDDECATAPTYAKGASFTFANTTGVTLYAVYADGGGTKETITKTMSEIVSENSYTVSSGSNATMYKTLTLNGDITLSTTGDDNCGSFWGTSPNNEWRLYQNKSGNAIITAASGCELTGVKFTFSISNTGALFNGSDAMISGTAVSASGTSAEYTVGNSGSATNGQVKITAVEVKYTKVGSYSNYSTTCVDAPEVIVDPEEINATAAGVVAGVIEAAYDHVNEANISVALFNDQNCTEAFTGEWLTASLNGDKNIAYTIAEYTSYASNRTAYIKLTAPETNGEASPAVVVIPVTQAKMDAVFTSLEDLVASDVPANSNVTVSFSNVVIKEIYMYNSNRRGLTFNIQKDNADIKIYFNADVPADWIAGGSVSGTLTNCPWKIYSNAWQLAPANEWAWSNLTYVAPPEIASIEIRGTATSKTYVDGQAFNPAGLSVYAIYDNSNEEDVTAYATWTYDPEKLSEGDTEVEVTAEYNSKSDTKTVNGLSVNPIPNKTIAQFIAAGGTRCYLEGTVSNYTNTTKGYFDLTDASGTIYIYGCSSPSSFAAGDNIKVIAETYELYNSKHEAKNVEFVSKISPVEITIADKNMQEGETWTIEATTDPESASENISYSIKEGSDDCITLSGNVITATAIGEATIIASVPDGTGYLANSVEFTVTVVPVQEPAAYYEKVTSTEDITDGEYLIVYETGNLAFNGGLTKLDDASNAIAIEITDNIIYSTEAIEAAKFTIDATNRTIKSASGYYIGQTSDANGLASSTTTTYTNTLSIDGGDNFVAVSGGAYMRYNATSGQDRFRYFKSSTYTSQKAVQLYKKATYSREVSVSIYGTICLPNSGIMEGASIFEIAYFDNIQRKIFFDEVVNGHMVAGRPYIFLPNEGVNKIMVSYIDQANAPAGNYKGLYGSYTKTLIEQTGDNYILYNNQYYVVNSTAYVGVNRAYLNLEEAGIEPVAPAPGRRRVSMNVQGKEVATGILDVEEGDHPMKVFIDNQLFIIRGGQMYDMTGKKVQ